MKKAINPRSTQKSQLVIAGLLGMGGLTLFAGLAILVSQFFLSATQDVRRQALVPNGISELTLVPGSGNLDIGKPQQIAIKLNTNSTKIYGVQLKFNVITNGTIGALDAAANRDITLNQLYSKVERTSDGYLVTYAAVPQEVSSTAYYANNAPTTILTLSFTPTTAGEIKINFDTEDTKTKSFEPNSIDQLRTIGQTTYNVRTPATVPPATVPPATVPPATVPPATVPPATVPPATAAPTTPVSQYDDLYFANLTEDRMKFHFFEKNTSTAVPDSQLQAGKWYTLRHTTYVLSTKKSSNIDLRTVSTRINVNNTAVQTRNTAYSDFTSKDTGYGVAFELNFVAQDTNIVTLSVDTTNVIAEKAEDNNTLTAQFKYGSTISCNELCTSNAQCPADYRCYNTGTEQRCRLVTNVSSTSCASNTNQSLARRCNEYCADTSECAVGYSCWYNKCRNPRNLDSIRCANPPGYTTSNTVYTQAGCNVQCASSRGCQAGLRCYNGACRHPLNVTDISCSPYSSAGNLGGSKGEEKPTPTPIPTSKPTATPAATTPPVVDNDADPNSGNYSPLPTAAPSESAYDLLHILFGYSFAQVAAMKVLGVPVSIIVIGLGVVILLAAVLLIANMGSRRHKYMPPVLSTPVQMPTTTTQPATSRVTPASMHTSTQLSTELPRQTVPQPQPQPQPQPTVQATEHNSMVDRLRQKGVQLGQQPEQQ